MSRPKKVRPSKVTPLERKPKIESNEESSQNGLSSEEKSPKAELPVDGPLEQVPPEIKPPEKSEPPPAEPPEISPKDVIHLHPNAHSLEKKIREKIEREERKLSEIAVSILIWGPSPDSEGPFARLRIEIREELQRMGHLPAFSEEYVVKGKYSTKIQQSIHAPLFDLIFSIPCSYGAIAEIHDFMQDPRLNKKMIIFIDATFDYGYSFQSIKAMATQGSYSAIPYNGEAELHLIKTAVYETVRIERELKYLNRGK